MSGLARIVHHCAVVAGRSLVSSCQETIDFSTEALLYKLKVMGYGHPKFLTSIRSVILDLSNDG